jgi:hypothetical protein
MNRLKTCIAPLITGLIALSLTSCASPGSNRQNDSASLPNPGSGSALAATQPDSVAATAAQAQKTLTSVARQPSRASRVQANSSAQAAKTVALNIYQVDSQCETLVPEPVAVPADSPLESAVGTVLKQTDSADFELAGYRVQVNPTSGVATVDFRLSPNSRRKFVSLSMCEQFALFGSLRKTLTNNSRLKIKNVRFTERGQEIVL